jgi:hypothetical protein
MKQVLCLLAITMSFLFSSQVWSQDVGSPECGMAQQATQDAVASGGQYKNHGQMVKTAAQAVNPYLDAGDISEECHSCIVSQFARKIPIADQESCGPIVEYCSVNADCAIEEYCQKAVGDCGGQGNCEVKPTECPLISDPICGCDGMTYENACAAAALGVSVNYLGECIVECAHSPCVTGGPLDSTCDPCVETVCAADDVCCLSEWDSLCVEEAVSLCGISCPEATCAWVDSCGGQAPGGCWCDAECCVNGDCCSDAESYCGITCE